MKAAIVMPLADQRGGAEMMLQHLLYANRKGPRMEYVLAFLEEGHMVREAEALGYRVRVFAAGRLRQPWRHAQTIISLAAWLRREQVSVVVSWMSKAHLYAAPAARLARVPAVLFQHSIPDKYWLDRWATRLPARAVFCCSGAAQQAQKSMYPSHPTRVIYPAVDLERFESERLPAPAEARSELGLPASGLLIGMAARLQRWKGLHVFLEAAASVARVHSGVRFVVVGGAHFAEPDYLAELVERADRAGISNQVYFAGYQKDIALWTQALDIVVNASIEPEPFGMTLIEAMALGKAVVATRQGGPLEIINNGKDGLLVAPGDALDLADAVSRLAEREDDRKALGAAARQRARRFGTDRLASEVAWHLAEVAR